MKWLIPEPGRAVYHPEVRAVHAVWWNDTESFLRLDNCVSKDPNAPLFGVTPAMLSKVIAEKTVAHIFSVFGEEPRQWLTPMLANDFPLWTEYCAYRLVACKLDIFEKFHREPSSGTPHLYTGCWSTETTLNHTIALPDNSLFLVVQSNTHVPLRKVVSDLHMVFK
jgi:hypothetical protein